MTHEAEVARRFMAQRLGPDWELLLLQADAYPRQGPAEDVDAAELRAIELVRDVSEDWRPGLREAVAYAWRLLSGTDDEVRTTLTAQAMATARDRSGTTVSVLCTSGG